MSWSHCFRLWNVVSVCYRVFFCPTVTMEAAGSEWHNVLGRVHRAPWPEVGQRADRVDRERTFALLTSTPGESQRPEDQPGEGARPSEPGWDHQSPEQHPGPPAPRGEGRGTRLPALQPRSAHMVWPVWRLHLGPVQAEPAVCQWV